jgi:hypothetical protein
MASACRNDVTVGRPVAKGFYQRGLAKAADRIIRAHCPGISEPNLRRAVGAVLENAGHTFPNPKKDAAKFDQMLQPFPPDPIDEAAERAAKEREERLRDRPI